VNRTALRYSGYVAFGLVSLLGVTMIIEAAWNQDGVGGLAASMGALLIGWPLAVLGMAGVVGILLRQLFWSLLLGLLICALPLLFA
jgi:hypothetical protein